MKKASVSVMKKIGILIFCALIAFVFVSCDYFNLDIKQVLSEKLDTASVEKAEFPDFFIKNIDDVACVPSNMRPLEFSVVVRNPRDYNLSVLYEFDDGTTPSNVSVSDYNNASDLSEDLIYINDRNRGSFYIRFSDAFIKSRELSERNISGRVFLQDTNTGRTFDPYPVTLRANTPPCEIENVMLQRDASENYYVLCFEMCDFSPDSYGHIQDDVHVLNINGTEYYLNPTSFSGDFYTNPTYTAACNQFSATDPGVQPLKTGGDVFEPSGNSGLIPIYFSTNVAVPATISAANEKTWSFFLEDDEGLTTETHKVSNITKQLKPPVVNVTNNGRYTVGENGYYAIQVSHDGLCIDEAVANEPLKFVYTAYDSSGHEIEVGSGSSTVYKNEENKFVYSINLPRGVYHTLKIMVKKEGFTTSDPVVLNNITILQPANFYVSSEGHDGWTGTVGSPLRTIQYAIDKFHEEFTDETVCNIYVMDDITPEYSVEGDFVTIPYIECDDGTKTFNIIGYEGNRTIDARKNLDATGSVIRVENGAIFNLSNVTITGGYSMDGDLGGGGLSVGQGAHVSVTNCTISGNTAANGGSGGGVSLSGENITFQMSGSTVSGNTSGSGGGGIFVMSIGGDVSISNSTISGNTASSEYGGGIHIWQGPVVLNGCTISSNTAPHGGAIALRNQATASLKLGGATSVPAGADGNSVYNDIYVEDGKSIEIGSNFTYSGAQALIDFESYTQNSTVFTGYPARANGKFKPENASFIITSEGKLSIDPNIYVSSSSSSPAGSSSGDGSQAHPFNSLTAAFNRIKTLDVSADYIIHVSGTISHSNGLSITRSSFGTNAPSSITIQGTNPENDKLSRDANSRSTVAIDGSVTFTVIFENLTIKGGNADGNGNYGGGLSLALDTNVTLKNCIVTGNSTATSSGGLGGGIYVNGNLTLDGTSVTGNTSTVNGGGIYVDVSGTLNIKGKVTVTGNTNSSGASATTNNVYLSLGRVITIDGALDPASRIGVSTNAQPHAATATSAADTVQITSGLTNSGLTADQLNAVFSSDKDDYVVLTSTGECKLAVSGGSFGGGDIPTNNLNYAFLDAASGGNAVTYFYSGYPKDIYVRTNIPGANDPIPPSDITYTFTLKSGNSVVTTLSGTPSGDTVKVTIPSTLSPGNYPIAPDNYTLYVTAAYNGITYDCSYPLECREHVSVGMVPVAGATITGAVSDSSVFIDGRTVTISNLYVSDHEVTQAEYFDVMGTNPSEFASDAASGETQENRPVEKVNWYAAIAYCNKLSLMEGLTPCYSVSGVNDWGTLPNTSIPTESNTAWNAATCNFNANGYRLPTEAEWEYIARGGNGLTGTQTTYSGSSSIDSVAWYTTNSSNKTHEVKKKTANSLGIYDMSGNVYEWCWDWADEITATTGSSGPSSVPSAGNKLRSTRGGAYTNNSDRCRVYFRDNLSPQNKGQYLGFRVVRNAQ